MSCILPPAAYHHDAMSLIKILCDHIITGFPSVLIDMIVSYCGSSSRLFIFAPHRTSGTLDVTILYTIIHRATTAAAAAAVDPATMIITTSSSNETMSICDDDTKRNDHVPATQQDHHGDADEHHNKDPMDDTNPWTLYINQSKAIVPPYAMVDIINGRVVFCGVRDNRCVWHIVGDHPPFSAACLPSRSRPPHPRRPSARERGWSNTSRWLIHTLVTMAKWLDPYHDASSPYSSGCKWLLPALASTEREIPQGIMINPSNRLLRMRIIS